jgi:POT family proton-dependent oligopeptide transporter
MVSVTGDSPQALTQMLYHANDVGMVWYLMAIIAVAAAVGLFFYGRWILTLARPVIRPVAQPVTG